MGREYSESMVYHHAEAKRKGKELEKKSIGNKKRVQIEKKGRFGPN